MSAAELFDAAGRPVIRLTSGDLPQILDQMGAALAGTFGDRLFSYAGGIARIYPAEKSVPGVRRADGAVIVHPVEAPHLVELLGRSATFERFDARRQAFTAADPPRRAADAYLARGHWPELHPLKGFLEAPTITLDGRIIDEPGYDFHTGLFAAFNQIDGYRRPPERPDLAKAKGAAEYLRETVKTFPFASPCDESALLALLVTAVVRRAIAAAPIFAITAPAPGTGKSLLAETAAIIATGRRAAVLSLGADEKETEKRLHAVLLAGDAVLCLDNCEKPLHGDLLCQLSTQAQVRIRPLGGSAVVTVPTSALITATGNNLSVLGDLKRRTVLIGLDAGVERPEHRRFDGDHLATIAAARGKILTAALTIVKAYVAAGAPALDNWLAVGSFEQWDRMVRRPLVWAGLPDPLLPAESLRAADPDLDATRFLFAAWYAHFRSAPMSVNKVVAEATACGGLNGDPINAELRDALNVVCMERIAPRRFAGWLLRHKDQIAEGLRLEQAGYDAHAKALLWRIAEVR